MLRRIRTCSVIVNDNGRNFCQPAAAKIVAAFDADVDAADVAAVVAVAQQSEQWLPSVQPRCVPAA